MLLFLRLSREVISLLLALMAIANPALKYGREKDTVLLRSALIVMALIAASTVLDCKAGIISCCAFKSHIFHEGRESGVGSRELQET